MKVMSPVVWLMLTSPKVAVIPVTLLALLAIIPGAEKLTIVVDTGAISLLLICAVIVAICGVVICGEVELESLHALMNIPMKAIDNAVFFIFSVYLLCEARDDKEQ
ncbi:membrane protein of unknown function [Moritella yayanosii]|uniref:Uncharacterized protein n=1 Tax=Moritella yayanosii TaxID=69539 RepID=A0A330LIF5_9GAMM|nr:membrane protein of unknown function [Moritella yayanosii]